MAHYDHVGFGQPTGGDSVWNRFIDNAAGSAMLLEIGREMAIDPPARSVAFVWVTAEEQGLLGSNWFVHTSSLPLERVVAAINSTAGRHLRRRSAGASRPTRPRCRVIRRAV